VREWDSNGTNFGFNPALGHVAGEFGHNDYYPVVVAACQERGLDGATALKAMVLLDEIRGRLAEVFSLKTYKIDHVVHGAIASAAVYVALHGGTPEQIESAIGMFVAHYIPWRAIRAGKQLSDSKGASAAISAEAAVLCAKRALKGFIGPKDIFRNPESMFRQFIKTNGDSPFELHLSHSGDDFAVMGMHFKLGLYEHQSAGALQGALDLWLENPGFVNDTVSIVIKAYEPAFGIIGDPAKRDPHTRQSADHSMVYIVSTLLRKASELQPAATSTDDLWKALMLAPEDYGQVALHNEATRNLMEKIAFEHGGQEYDDKYPDGIPTSMVVTLADGTVLDSGLVMYPGGHARNTSADLGGILAHKWALLGSLALSDGSDIAGAVGKLNSIGSMSASDLMGVYEMDIAARDAVD
jgi:2-methylcitrate dehydratase